MGTSHAETKAINHQQKHRYPRKLGKQPSTRLSKIAVNMFFSDNFTVVFNDWFRVHELVRCPQQGGLVRTTFEPLQPFADMTLSIEALRILLVPNAGGNSLTSEVLSYEMLKKCFNASLHKTELEVEYFPRGGCITDYVSTFFERRLGVSVTRAMKYPASAQFEFEDAERLLRKKLGGILQSSANSMEPWSKQVLHIWTGSRRSSDLLSAAYHRLDSGVPSNTVVLLTTAAHCPEIFTNR